MRNFIKWLLRAFVIALVCLGIYFLKWEVMFIILPLVALYGIRIYAIVYYTNLRDNTNLFTAVGKAKIKHYNSRINVLRFNFM